MRVTSQVAMAWSCTQNVSLHSIVTDQTPSADILIKFATGLEGVRRALVESISIVRSNSGLSPKIFMAWLMFVR